MAEAERYRRRGSAEMTMEVANGSLNSGSLFVVKTDSDIYDHASQWLETGQDDRQKTQERVADDGNGAETLVYKVTDRPPIHLAILFALQQALLSLSMSLAISLLVAESVCATDDADFKALLLSTTLFMNGVTTLTGVTVGVRLPLYQGAAADYIIPLLAMVSLDKSRCTLQTGIDTNSTLANITSNVTTDGDAHMDLVMKHVQGLEGSLMIAGLIHTTIGGTGLIVILIRFIGPVTIVSSMLLIGIYIMRSVLKFTQVHWGVAICTCSIAIILSVYLSRRKTPIPFWSKQRGFHIIYFPLHQVFAILIAIMIGWMLSAILTVAGVFTDDPDNEQYLARTDARSDVIGNAKWFHFPYPGYFGTPSFDLAAFIGYLIATFTAILDSIGDYYACARISQVPPPPRSSISRGLFIEGICTIVAGALGCGHGTNTYGGNIGAIGITKVASRFVFLLVGIIYILFGIIGKVSAVFVTIPYPVLGGALIVMFGMFNGVVLSNLQTISLSSTRNLAIIGTSILVGLMVPYWVELHPNGINTGNADADHVLKMLMGSPNLSGAVLACFLDNTVPGTREERGLLAWENTDSTSEENQKTYLEGKEVYELPCIPKRFRSSKCLRYIPWLPKPEVTKEHYVRDKNDFKFQTRL